MSQPNTVTVKILDKDYQVACPREQEAELVVSAKYLDKQMRSIRETGKVIGLERIAVMAALNISYELCRPLTTVMRVARPPTPALSTASTANWMTLFTNSANSKSADPSLKLPEFQGRTASTACGILSTDPWHRRQADSPRADNVISGGLSLLLVCKSGMTGKPYTVQAPPP